MTPAFRLIPAAWLTCLFAPTPATKDMEHPKPSLRLSLTVTEKTIKRGTVPQFKFTLRNEGKNLERVLDLTGGRRSDLQDTYYDLEVTQGGKAVSVPRAISDPGVIAEKDFLTLKPGEEVTFELKRFASAWDRLPPGKYQARVRFWQDPFRSAKTAVLSPNAEFVVQE